MHSEIAINWMGNAAEPLPFTALHRHEVRNAVRLAVMRKRIEHERKREIFQLMDRDLKEGILVYQPIQWTTAFQEAERLGESLAESTGIRAADLLHLGIASSLGAVEFITFDKVQAKAAGKAGFECWTKP